MILGDDDIIHFYEGTNLRLKIDSDYFDCKGLDYDEANGALFVSCDSYIKVGNQAHSCIYMDASFILSAVYQNMIQLSQIDLSGKPISRIISGEFLQCGQLSVPNAYMKGTIYMLT